MMSPARISRFGGHRLSLIPLYAEETQLKLEHGTDPLIDKLNEVGVTELLDPHRPNACLGAE